MFAKTMSTAIPGSVSQTPVRPILVLGLGNLLLRDEGFGPALAGCLQKSLLEEPSLETLVEVVDGGTMGLGLLGLLSGRQAVIFLDAFRSDLPPGSLSIRRDFLPAEAGSQEGRTAHDGNAAGLLAVAALTGDIPSTLALVGVEPLLIETGIGLSAPVQTALLQAEAQAKELIHLFCSRLPGESRGSGDLRQCA
jgi:hydrogenase maturation protease